jgi:hypothetical protein
MNKTTVIYERAKVFQVNAADGISMEDTLETPLRSVYEAAECRLWYSPAMVFEVARVWKAAAGIKWGKRSFNAGPGWQKSGSLNCTANQTPGTGDTGRVTAFGLAIAFAAVAGLLLV